eukprot:SAG31_NODE_11886_length_988_cov_3.539933_1_plen_83_part_00
MGGGGSCPLPPLSLHYLERTRAPDDADLQNTLYMTLPLITASNVTSHHLNYNTASDLTMWQTQYASDVTVPFLKNNNLNQVP